MDDLLSILSPADTIFQKQDMSYRRAMPVIEAVKPTIAEYRNDEKLNEILESAEKLMSTSVNLQTWKLTI